MIRLRWWWEELLPSERKLGTVRTLDLEFKLEEDFLFTIFMGFFGVKVVFEAKEREVVEEVSLLRDFRLVDLELDSELCFQVF